ncbi:MAG: hypothetical protein KC940_14785 [Candidatus Omnitrophica bacterium]|nr:hypothetical protein [Candidatus Omnitrophota bacterium]
MNRVFNSFLLAVLFGIPAIGWGQSAIGRFTIDGGGGIMEEGNTRLRGTVGQPDASVGMTGGDIRLRGGFWPGAGGPASVTNTPTQTPTGTLPTETSTPTPTSTTDGTTPTSTFTPTPTLTGTLPTATETPTGTLPTNTPTETPTGTLPTPTETPGRTNYDVQPDPIDGFIDTRDLIEWVSRVQEPDGDPVLLFDFSLYWQGQFPPGEGSGGKSD